MDNSSIQHTQMLLGMAILVAMLGTLILTLASRWLGGVWITLIATLTACLAAYQPLIGSTLFSRIQTDLLQRILLAAIPFTLIVIALSLNRVPRFARILFALIGPAILFSWVFYHYDVTIPRQALFLHKVVPISLAVFVVWGLIEPIAVRTPGTAAPLTVAMLAAGGGFLLMLSAENQAGLMSLMIPATAGGAAIAGVVAALIRKPITLARGPVLLWITLIASQFAFLWMSTDQLPLNYLEWLAAVPLLSWIPQIGPIHRLKPWARETIRFLLIAIPLITMCVLAKKDHDREAAAAGDPFGLVWPQPAAPTCPNQIPIPKTINPPTIT